MKRLKIYAALALLLVLAVSCDENTVYKSSVPSFPVYLQLNIAAEYPHFVPTNTSAYLTFTTPRYPTDALGYGGILIYIGLDAAYHAYDMACPVCLKRDQPVEVDGIYARCPLCGEEYDLSYGLAVPTHGISHEALRQYTVTADPTHLTVR